MENELLRAIALFLAIQCSGKETCVTNIKLKADSLYNYLKQDQDE